MIQATSIHVPEHGRLFTMVKILVISDTHDDSRSMEWTLNFLETERIDTVIHLGDYYDDANILELHGHNLIRVPGTWDTCYYPDPQVENRKFIDIEDWKIFLTHTPGSHYNDLADDIKPETIIAEGRADVFLYGHTHLAEIRHDDTMVYINPGHLSSHENRGYPMTFGLLEFDHDTLHARIMRHASNTSCFRETFDKASLRMPKGIQIPLRSDRVSGHGETGSSPSPNIQE